MASIDKRPDRRFPQALALHRSGNIAAARRLYRLILASNPKHFDALYLSGVIALQTGQHLQAIEHLQRAVDLKPDLAEVHNDFGMALQQAKRYDAALRQFDQAIALNPQLESAHNNRGNALFELKQYDAAVQSFDKAITMQPNLAEAHANRGNALLRLHRHEAALQSFDRAILLRPDAAEPHSNRGNVLQELRRYEDALQSFARAISLRPDFAEAFSNRGNALLQMRHYDAALDSCNRAITLQPELAEAHSIRGSTLLELKQYAAAAECFDHAIRLDPGLELAHGALAYARMLLCDWADIGSHVRYLTEMTEQRQPAASPFTIVALIDDPSLHRKAAELWMADKYPKRTDMPPLQRTATNAKLRIGYFSADFHDHATTYLMAGMLEQHDREKFETIAVSFGPDSEDAMRNRVQRACDHFLDVQDRSDRDIALLARKLAIDIAVDLKGITQGSRSGIFSFRAAPVQVSFLGYPGTMGANYMDYILADQIVIPPRDRPHFVEQVVHLPYSYQVNDDTRAIADRNFTRTELGLPPTGFVFCCFNNNYKITPAVFDCWMRILQAVEGSVIWLLEGSRNARDNLSGSATASGVDPTRLVFAGHMPAPDHLARHRLADLFIDTLPYNAHTTASDALWAGLPVLTCVGKAFAGRVAASLLTAIDLPELITTTWEEYVARAIELAANPAKLAAIRQRLAANRNTTPLFDTRLSTRHIEAAFCEMHRRYLDGTPPEHFAIAAQR